MTDTEKQLEWGTSYRLVASEKWKAKSAAMGRDVTETLVAYARPRPGMQVLDIASGTGEPAITLAGCILPGGHVTALDLSADLLAIAEARARQRNLTNFKIHRGDAQHLPFVENSFDLATSRFGVMFFPDVMRALRELHRVLRPGARACFAVWGPVEQPYWASTMAVVHQHVGGPLLGTGAADPFRFSATGTLSAVLREAGFAGVDETSPTVPWSWPGTAEEVWEQARAVSTPFQPMLQRVPEDEWPALHRRVVAAIERYRVDDRIEFGATIVLASGTKP
jgi:ubiquinone/menaquinone biosynthesis C-methylase UbiE